MFVGAGSVPRSAPSEAQWEAAIGPGLDKKWSNYFLPGMLACKTSFFWVLALTAVQVRWVNVEINFQFVLDLDGPSAHSDRLDAEGGLLEFGLALVMHRVARHFEHQFFAHAVQHER